MRKNKAIISVKHLSLKRTRLVEVAELLERAFNTLLINHHVLVMVYKQTERSFRCQIFRESFSPMSVSSSGFLPAAAASLGVSCLFWCGCISCVDHLQRLLAWALWVSSLVFPAGTATDTLSSLFLTPVGLCYSAFVPLGYIINSELIELCLDPSLPGLIPNNINI